MKILQINISPGHNFYGQGNQPPGEHPIVAVNEVECVAGKGLSGDRFFDYEKDYEGQATFISSEVFTEVCRQLGVVDKLPGVTRRNIVTQGVDLNSLVGKKFVVQGVEFEGVEECSPCRWMNVAIAPGAEAALRNRGGLRARILTSGRLRVDVE